jgi:nucleoside-diphosphate-sugar epimerase
MNDETRPVLITGATGFLGAWTIARLIEARRPVVASDLTCDTRRLDQLLPAEAQASISWRTCDVTDGDAVQAIVAEVRPSVIIHLAALQIPACRANPVRGAEVNVIGQINVFEAASRHGVDRVIYTSSVAAKPRGPANAPANLYGVFKKAGEEIARIYWEEHGISSLGLRPFIVYGAGRDDGETSAITKAIRAAALGEPYAMPFTTRSCFQYAGEVAEIFRRCAETRWQGALLSDLTTEVNSTDELLAVIRAEVPGALITPSDRVRLSPTGGFDNAPLKAVIGDWPHTTLAEGVRETLRQYRALADGEERPAVHGREAL